MTPLQRALVEMLLERVQHLEQSRLWEGWPGTEEEIYTDVVEIAELLEVRPPRAPEHVRYTLER